MCFAGLAPAECVRIAPGVLATCCPCPACAAIVFRNRRASAVGCYTLSKRLFGARAAALVSQVCNAFLGTSSRHLCFCVGGCSLAGCGSIEVPLVLLRIGKQACRRPVALEVCAWAFRLGPSGSSAAWSCAHRRSGRPLLRSLSASAAAPGAAIDPSPRALIACVREDMAVKKTGSQHSLPPPLIATIVATGIVSVSKSPRLATCMRGLLVDCAGGCVQPLLLGAALAQAVVCGQGRVGGSPGSDQGRRSTN